MTAVMRIIAMDDGYVISVGDWGTYVANPAIYALAYD